MVAVIIDPMITDYFDNRQCIKETQKITNIAQLVLSYQYL
jgi:hypothetical protein